VKLMFTLGHVKKIEEVSKIMQSNIADEITPRTRPDVFLKPAFTPAP